MKNLLHNDPIDALGAIYENMYEHTVENLQKAEEKSEKIIHILVDEAKDKAIKIEKLSHKEAENIAKYVKRDINEIASYISKSGRDLKGWLGYETSLLETESLDLLLNAADETTVELLQLKESVPPLTDYYSGEVTGPGTLICDQCGEKYYFYKAGVIPACSKCYNTKFHRQIILS